MWSLAVVDMKLMGIVKSIFEWKKSKYKSVHWYYIWYQKVGECVKSIYFNTYWSTFLLDTIIECSCNNLFSIHFVVFVSCVWINEFCLCNFLNIGSSKKLNGYILSRFRLTITLCLWLYFGPLIFIVLWTKEAIMKNKKFSHIYSVEIK